MRIADPVEDELASSLTRPGGNRLPASPSQCVEHSLGRKGLMPYLGTKRLQGIVDSNPHRSHGADQAAFSNALGPKLRRSLPRLDMFNEYVGHLASHGHKIVGQVSVKQIGVIAIGAFFEQDRSNALYDTPAYLLVHQKRVNYATAVVDGPMAKHCDEACLGIDLNVASMHAISHEVPLAARYKTRGDRKLHIKVWW
jgi:hypothetical protein